MWNRNFDRKTCNGRINIVGSEEIMKNFDRETSLRAGTWNLEEVGM